MVTHLCPLDDLLHAGMRSVLAVGAPGHNDLLHKINISKPIVQFGRDCTRNIAALYLAMVSELHYLLPWLQTNFPNLIL